MSETPDTTPEGENAPVEAAAEPNPTTPIQASPAESTPVEAVVSEAATPDAAPSPAVAPAPAESASVESAPVEPAPVEPAPVESAPVGSTPVQPAAPVRPAPPVHPVAPAAQPAAPVFTQPAPQLAPQPTTPIPPAFGGAPVAVGATQPEKKRSIALPVVAAVAVGAVLGGAAGAGVAAWAVSSSVQNQPSASAGPQTITVNNPEKVNSVTAIAAKAGPSVVTIDVTAGSSGGTGSGVILNSDGYVLTNTHVVTLDGESANGTIEVTTYDGKLYKATVVGTDPTLDLAVIKLTGASGLTPIDFGDATKLNVGDHVVAIGAPLGLSNTVTDGIVSALDRSISIASSAAPTGGSDDGSDGSGGSDGDGSGPGPFDFWNDQNQGSTGGTATSTISLPVIQTDASINPGNSGGALVNNDGQLIGINVAIASTGSSGEGQSGSIGVGFSIPEDVAQRVANEIIKNGSATHGLLGASVQDATAADSSTVGALIKEITSGGAADQAGLKAGDVVTNFNGAPITNATDLTAQVRALAAGSTAKLTYTRSGSATTVTVTLGSLPKS